MTAKSVLELDPRELEREIERLISENPPARRAWTEREVITLKRLYAKQVPMKTIAKTLGRSYGAIRNKVLAI